MPNIDTSTIDGFDAMSAEEKVNALLGVEIPEAVDLAGYVEKSVFDAKASEAADWKKKHNALLTEDQQKKQQEAEELDTLKNEVATLRKEKTVSEYKAAFMEQGYDAELAASTAAALEAGDMKTVFANQAKQRQALEQQIRAELLKNTPGADGNLGTGGKDAVPAVEEQAREIGKAKAEANRKATEGVQSFYLKH